VYFYLSYCSFIVDEVQIKGLIVVFGRKKKIIIRFN
jgi:hypothetical protein